MNLVKFVSQASAHVTSDVTVPAVRRQVERRQQQKYELQRRQIHDDYDYDYYDYDKSYSDYNNYDIPRSSSVSSFHGVTDNSELADGGLFVQRITVGPF